MSQAAAGWYDQGDGTQRYWDGSAWTDHSAPSAVPQAPSGGASPAAPMAVPPAAPVAVPPGYAAMPSAAPEIKPRKRVWPWVLGIGGGLLVVIIALVAWGATSLFNVISGPIDTVNAFEGAMESNDCVATQKTLTDSFLASSGWDDCAAFYAEVEALTPSQFNANETSTTNGITTVTAILRYAGDTTTYVGTYSLVKVNGDWRIDAVSVDPSDS